MHYDIVLIFVPQWSPFQPPLSLPSLAAWLKRAGFRVLCLDANIMLYHWLLSDECADLLLGLIDTANLSAQEKNGYRSIVRSCTNFRQDIANLKEKFESLPDQSLFVENHYIAIKALSTYLEVISTLSDDFSISPYDFRLKDDNPMSSAALERFADRPPELIQKFLDHILDKDVIPQHTSTIGLSCIGEEQLGFTLLFGRAIKRQLPDTQVVVGGTILPRIFERGVLKADWFGRYFDVIVRNEGEKPCEMLLRNLTSGRATVTDVPGLIYLDSAAIRATAPQPALKPDEVPIPDFDDIPLSQYICSEITLPILASRGCYWGKCEFCHHFMVYGDGYSAYHAKDTAQVIHHLADKYQVKRFAFNDEAIPPKIVKLLGDILPAHEDSGYTFTGLIKFEKYYRKDHFVGLSRIGFRSLYIGLESASERVLDLMKKRATRSTIESNLRDATEAGIWTHCFLFFGFPGETNEDAQETYDFIMRNSDIVGSFGCGTFVLEHNAPIQRHLSLFNLEITADRSSDISVYYNYTVNGGVDNKQALAWAKKLQKDSADMAEYRTTNWIPREFLLSLLSKLRPNELLDECIKVDLSKGIPPRATLPKVANIISIDARPEAFAVNRMRVNVALVRNQALESLKLGLQHSVLAVDFAQMNRLVGEWLEVTAAVEQQECDALCAHDDEGPATVVAPAPSLA
jgi:anaerobic magnesium-protoporphyrin IX monomethyl ester cyclase